MSTEKFSKKEAISFGWNALKSNLGFFIGLLLLLGVISWISGYFEKELKENIPLSIIVSLIFSIVNIILSIGLINISLKFADNIKAKFSDLISCSSLFFNYLAGSILYGLIVLAGFILLIIPGIIWSIKFSFFGYFIVDKKLGPVEALKRSAEITQGAKWDLFLFGILLGLINILGVICLIIGLFAAIPTTMVARAFVYRKLSSQEGSIQVSSLEKTR